MKKIYEKCEECSGPVVMRPLSYYFPGERKIEYFCGNPNCLEFSKVKIVENGDLVLDGPDGIQATICEEKTTLLIPNTLKIGKIKRDENGVVIYTKYIKNE